MLQAYVWANAGLFLSYWFLKPAHAALALILLHLIVFGGLQRPDIPNSLEFAIMSPLAILSGVGVGGFVSRLISKPAYSFYARSFMGKCLLAALAYAGTLVSWQIAPQTYWNYVFICALSQLIIIIYSYERIEHAQSWGGNGKTQFVVHYHYLLMWLCLNAPFAVGQSVAPHLPTYYWTMVFLSVGLFWVMIHSFFMVRFLPDTVAARAIMIVKSENGDLLDQRWQVET